MDGIVGIYSVGDRELVNKAFLATGACQHRGKASTGLAVGSHRGIHIYKGLGRIAEVIDYNIIKVFQDLDPVAAIGNIGSSNPEFVKDAIPKIRKIMETATDIDVKMNAKVALGRLGDPMAM